MVKPRLLVTRFAPHAQRLTELLNEQGIYSYAQPLLHTEEIVNSVSPFKKSYDLIIAVSRNAVLCTDKLLCGDEWPQSHYLAVGDATQALLKSKVNQSVSTPIKSFNTEGLLALPALNNIKDRSILILRGVGGRELLKEELLSRGATVDYFEAYQRVAVELPRSTTVQKWQQHTINGAIISSIELLEQLVCIACEQDKWLKKLTIYAPSERILKHAKGLGFTKTALLPSISHQKIIDYFIDEGSYERD